MKVGDYVRYKYENCIYIGKIKFISEVMGFDETLQFEIDNCIEGILKQDIIKSSPNIIDEEKCLIEVGDYVNGIYIDTVEKEQKRVWHTSSYGDDDIVFYDNDIQTIVTKEQFESMEYKVGE